jgi:LacI family transcriptional regulator
MAVQTKKITLKDIAARAGVSLTSASMYINGNAKKYHLSDAACKRIQDAINDLGYIPNIHARAIAKKQTLLIGMEISSGIDSSFWLNILSGIEETIRQDDYHMILSVSHANIEKELENIKFMLNKGIDGLFITPTGRGESNLDYLIELNKTIPVVTINKPFAELSGSYNDDYQSGALAAEHLIVNGHRKIVYLGPSEQPRADSFAQILRSNGLEFTGYANVGEFIDHIHEFTAAFCFCDYLAMDLYKKAASHNVRIPEDLSVLGFDNMNFSELIIPRLSTFNQYKKELGVSAAKIMLEKLKAKKYDPKPVHDRFMPNLIEGASIMNISSQP